MKHFDVVVVGGGHAGTEAALASARRGAVTALITFRKSDIGVMSCNPAIGGIGKGHLVREIDAMDGMMGLAADYAGIQFRLLNRSRGPAVQGPRVQVDRQRYAAFARDHVSRQPGLTVVEAEVVDFLTTGGEIGGVVLASGETIRSKAVVLTAGTFLRGMIHIGDERTPAGRRGSQPSVRLGERLAEVAVGLGRLKTGTPARLDGRTIDWSAVGVQEGDDDPAMMSFLSDAPVARQVPCGVTATNGTTHEIIRANLGRSAMHSGLIEGVGPRYCPSVEDKIARFADKETHNVFLEPEGLKDQTVYPNGISTSLPRDVQEAFIRTIRGLESVSILHYGYAIEYDYVDPRSLDRGLGLRQIPGLFLAGQINGTTGYEEAGAQGLLAGLNAAAVALGLSAVEMSRAESYIGVMIDDLVARGVSEPYRMFTSRAEFRLSLRCDNADSRLTPSGISRGWISAARATAFAAKMERLSALRSDLSASWSTPDEIGALGLEQQRDGQRRRSLDSLGLLSADNDDGIRALAEKFGAAVVDVRQVRVEQFYAPYVSRQAKEAAALRRDANILIPEAFDFSTLRSLSRELQDKLCQIRPANIAQAQQIEGMTPSAIVLLLSRLRVAPSAAVR